MTNEITPITEDLSYKCSACGRGVARDDLAVKRVQFTTMGEGARVIRSRVTGWVCVPCMANDPQYLQESARGERLSGKKPPKPVEPKQQKEAEPKPAPEDDIIDVSHLTAQDMHNIYAERGML